MYLKIAVYLAFVCIANASLIDNVVDDNDVNGCNLRACEQLCRRLGFTGGVCDGNRCSCHNFVSASESVSLESCDYRECDQRCRRLGFTGGACVGDRCKCDINVPLIESSVMSCNDGACNERCRKLGLSGGGCEDGKCKCNKELEHEIEDAICTFTAVSGCIPNICSDACHNLGHKNAVCVSSDKCVCYEVLHNDGVESSGSLEKCHNKKCLEQCLKELKLGGICIFGHCRCLS